MVSWKPSHGSWTVSRMIHGTANTQNRYCNTPVTGSRSGDSKPATTTATVPLHQAMTEVPFDGEGHEIAQAMTRSRGHGQIDRTVRWISSCEVVTGVTSSTIDYYCKPDYPCQRVTWSLLDQFIAYPLANRVWSKHNNSLLYLLHTLCAEVLIL